MILYKVERNFAAVAICSLRIYAFDQPHSNGRENAKTFSVHVRFDFKLLMPSCSLHS